jgi:hypothetical protein
MKSLIVLCIVSFIISAKAVEDRQLFKNCSTTNFCQRCRNVRGPSNYEVLLNSLYTDSDSVTAEIRDKNSGHLFLLKLKALEVLFVQRKINSMFPVDLKNYQTLRETLNCFKTCESF